MLNKVILIGRLGKDPDLKYTQSGTAVCGFSLAVPRKFNKDETDWVSIVAWRGLAENCANYLAKGSLAAIEGRLQVRTYETKEGQKRTAYEVVADDVRFLDNRKDSKGVDWDDLARKTRKADELENRDVSEGDIDDDIPF